MAEPSLALGIGLTGKPESMARFVQMREQGQAAAKKAKQDAIDAQNADIRKQLMSVGGGARLPVFEELYTKKKADVIRKLSEMAGNIDYNVATDMINGLAQDAKRWEEQTKLFYSDKNDANSYARKVLQTEKDPNKIAELLNNDAGTFKFDASNPNILVDDFTYVKPNEYIQKAFSDDNLFQYPTQGKVERINNQVYSNLIIPDETINGIVANSAADNNFKRSMESMFQEQRRAENKPINRQDKQYQDDFTAFFDSKMRGYGKSLKKSTEVTEAKGTTINNNLGNGSENPIGGVVDAVSFNIEQPDLNGVPKVMSVNMRNVSAFGDVQATLPYNDNTYYVKGNKRVTEVGAKKITYNQIGIAPVAKRDVQFPGIKFTKGQVIPQEYLDNFPNEVSKETVEFAPIAIGLTEPKKVGGQELPAETVYNRADLPSRTSYGKLTDKEKIDGKKAYEMQVQIDELNAKLPNTRKNSKELNSQGKSGSKLGKWGANVIQGIK